MEWKRQLLLLLSMRAFVPLFFCPKIAEDSLLREGQNDNQIARPCLKNAER